MGYPASTCIIERTCDDKYEGAIVKNLCREDYRAAANSALKFPPFRTELVKAVAVLVKNELSAYSKGNNSARYNGDLLSLASFKNEDLLEDACEIMPITHTFITATSKVGVKYEVNKQALALSAILNSLLPRSNFIYRINMLLTEGCCKTEVMDFFFVLAWQVILIQYAHNFSLRPVTLTAKSLCGKTRLRVHANKKNFCRRSSSLRQVV